MIYSDNFGASFRCQHPLLHSKMKHLEIDIYFVWNYVEHKELAGSHVHAADQIIYILTKADQIISLWLFRSQFRVAIAKIAA